MNLLLKAVSMRFTCTIAFFCTSSQPKEPHTPYPLGSTKPSKSVPCTPLICNSCRLADNTMSKIEEDSNMSWTQLRKPQKHRGNCPVFKNILPVIRRFPNSWQYDNKPRRPYRWIATRQAPASCYGRPPGWQESSFEPLGCVSPDAYYEKRLWQTTNPYVS